MKLFYLVIPIALVFFIGCSSTFKVTDYSSKEKFYEDVNNSIKNRDFNLVTADSSFTALAGSIIKDDSLKTTSKFQEKIIPLKDVKSIKYFGNAYEIPSATVWLGNGKELRAEQIKELPDSMIQLTNVRVSSGYISVDKIQAISYKTRWQCTLLGAPIGFASGALIGGILGRSGAIIHINDGGNHPTFDSGTSMVVGAAWGALIGTVTGIIVGYIIGWDHVYQFH